MILGEHLTMAPPANMFYITIDHKSKTNMKVAARKINIKIYQLVPKQLILGAHVTIAQRRISGDLTRSCS